MAAEFYVSPGGSDKNPGSPEREKMQNDLAAIIGIALPREDMERIQDSDKVTLLKARDHAAYEVRRLIGTLLNKVQQRWPGLLSNGLPRLTNGKPIGKKDSEYKEMLH